MEEVEKIHTWLETKRLENRISYKKMGDAIGYTDTGFKKALTGNRLSVIHLRSLVEQFELSSDIPQKFASFLNLSVHQVFKEPDSSSYALENNLTQEDVFHTTKKVYDHIDQFRSDSFFKSLIEKEAFRLLVKNSGDEKTLMNTLSNIIADN